MSAGIQRGLAPVKFAMDVSASRFTVQAYATGLLSVLGHNPTIGMRDFDGTIECEPATYENARIRVAVRTGTLEVLDEIKSDDRKKLEDVMYGPILEVSRFPDAVFVSTEVAVQKLGEDLLRVHVAGDLTFHGVTQRQSFDARATVLGTMLRISGGFPLRQSEYGIQPFSFAGGALRLKDEIKFNFELVARKQD